MIADQPVSHHIDPEALKEAGTGLSAQGLPNFDITIGVFWERLRV